MDYLLLHLETRAERDDWEALSSINTPYAAGKKTLLQPDGNVKTADAMIKQSILAAFTSPDLTETDRARFSVDQGPPQHV